jgi:hypothetical protein
MLYGMIRCVWSLLALLLAGCNPTVYVRDGVTDGDTFYLAPLAYTSGDPAVPSWVRFSLMRSACKLAVGGEIPSRVSTFDCETKARSHLVDAWQEARIRDDSVSDAYLDALLAVRHAGYLDEYVVHYFGKPSWDVPARLDEAGFQDYRRRHLRGHRPETRLIGSWGYGGTASLSMGSAD